MIFLKKFEAKGFKSYANNITLNFDDNMVGVVGPNGAGKSNVIDAIKWVLGEKSHKALRGKKSDDVIFHGSQNMPASEYAEVTLTFNNINKVLYSDLNEIAVTRKLNRSSKNNEYFINGKEVRLRDIQNIFLDTGLSKGSLCIISQGTVNWFADAKPEERRQIFEDAAGIGRYTKIKQENLRQLERAQNNFNRVSDLVKELSKDLKKLETQAEKLEKHKLYKDELTNLELKILVKDILKNRARLNEVTKKIKDSENDKNATSSQLQVLSREKEMYNNLINEIDISNAKLNEKFREVNSEFMKLEVKKSLYNNDLKTKIDSKNKEEKIHALRLLLNSLSGEIKTKKSQLEINETELKEYNAKLEKNIEEKERYDQLYIEMNSQLSIKQTMLLNFEANLKDNANIPSGAKNIIENKEAISGIHGILSNCIKIDKKYEKAILAALGSNIFNIIVNTNNDAKKAIEFLKNNKAGFATFMPIYNLKPKYIIEDYLNVASQLPGFVDIASNLVKLENKIFKTPIDILLAKIIIADNIDNAIEISKYTSQQYRIVTLDGDVVHPGGTLKGGYIAKNDSVFNLGDKIEILKKEIKVLNNELANKKVHIQNYIVEISSLQNLVSDKKSLIQRCQEDLEKLNNELLINKTKYQETSNMSYVENSVGNEVKDSFEKIENQYASLLIQKESYSEKIKLNEEKRSNIKAKLSATELAIENSRLILDKSSDIMLKYKEEEVNCQNVITNAKQKINTEYKMTIASAVEKYNVPLGMSDAEARDKIKKLSKSIEYLGEINYEAAKELKEKKERMVFLDRELKDVTQAKDEIIGIIEKSDEKAVSDFKKVIDEINKELPEIFKYLFGGGSCKIEFTDEENLLETGIDIIASPPGKKVNSLFALSGGEKTLVALSVLFSILRTSHFPLVILDEAESALDPSNVERFGNIISKFSNETQFLIITHRPGTMERCDSLYGATMETKGITTMYKVKLEEAKDKFSNNMQTDN